MKRDYLSLQRASRQLLQQLEEMRQRRDEYVDTVTQLERGLEKLELMVIMTCEHMETARSLSVGMEREE